MGALERTLRVSGVTAAANSAMLLTPTLSGSRGYGGPQHFTLVLQQLVPPGSLVKKGDTVSEFDRQYMLIRLDDYRAMLTSHELRLTTLNAQLDIRRKAYEQQIRKAKGNLDKAALDLKTAPVRSAIQTAHFKLAVAEAQASYEQLSKDLTNVITSERAAIRATELDLREAQMEMRRAQANTDRMIVRAPIDGLTVMQTVHRGGELNQIREGDQLYPGQPYLQVVDLRSMVVHASVNQVDAEQLRLGLQARVRVEACPDLELPARLYYIGALAGSRGFRGNYVKEIPIRLMLDRTDPRVIPNLSANADVVLETDQQAPLIPLEAVFSGAPGEAPFAWVQGPAGWEKTELELGLANYVSAAVRSGLHEGDVVATQWPLLPE
jgi:multidrug resistance efflux pump